MYVYIYVYVCPFWPSMLEVSVFNMFAWFRKNDAKIIKLCTLRLFKGLQRDCTKKIK